MGILLSAPIDLVIGVAQRNHVVVVPTGSAPGMLNASGIVSSVPAWALQTNGSYTMSHEPVFAPLETAAAFLEPIDRYVTLGYGPVVSVEPTSTVPTASSTLVSVLTTSTFSPDSISKRAVLTSEGYNELFQDLTGDCHDDSNGHIYFTIISPDGMPALDWKGESSLHHIQTPWHLTYTNTVREALFNDPEISSSCPSGHCRSKKIPGTDLRLEYVKIPFVFRTGRHHRECGYLDSVQKFSRLAVNLGEYGYLSTGAVPPIQVLDFVEQQMLTTYPTVEIGLILGCTVGLIFAIYVVAPLVVDVWFLLRAAFRTMRAKISRARSRLREVSLRRMHPEKTRDETVLGLSPIYSPDLVVPPPVYASAATSKMSVETEMAELRRCPGHPC